jgi:uroporphyrinogen-III synthase
VEGLGPSQPGGAESASHASPLGGYTIAFLEARRSVDLARLIERQGGACFEAPALHEAPLVDDPDVRAWLEQLAHGTFGVFIFLSGVGCRLLFEQAERDGIVDTVYEALAAGKVVARGPKPVLVLKRRGVRIDYVPPEPNTSEELLAGLASWPLAGASIGLQCYGGETPFLARLRGGLAARGASVSEVVPYRWEGPADEAPVQELITRIVAGEIDALLILSSSQIHNLFAIADEHGRAAELQRALADPRLLVAAVGPVAADAIESHGVPVGLQPEHPRMGHLVMALGPALANRPVKAQESTR